MSAQAGIVAGDSAPRLAGPPALWVLTALFLVGVAGLVYGLTGEAQIDLPLLTVSFLYLMGVSQAAVLFCAILRLVGAEWPKPYYRLAELATLAFFPFALLGFLLIVLYGQDQLFYWLAAASDDHLNPWLNINWLLARNLLALLLFYAVSTVYVLTALKPDLRSAAAGRVDRRRVERRLYLLSPLVIIAFVICNTLISWDFGMMLIEHWHSSVFPIHFSFGNLFAATAALVIFPALLRQSGASEPRFGTEQIRNVAMMVTAFMLLWLYFYWAQFFVIWFGNLPHETEPLWRQMYGHYAPYYWAMLAGCFFLPLATLIFAAVKRSVAAMCIIALGINAGIWINKYLTVVPVFSPEHRPFTNWLDIVVAAGLLAGFLAVLLLLVSRLPLYSYWEMAPESES